MRHLALLTLVALAAYPLSAHDHWRGPRRFVVVESPRCAPYRGWEERRWEARHWDDRWDDRWDRHERYERYPHDDCGEGRVVFRPLRPLDPPFEGRVVLRFR